MKPVMQTKMGETGNCYSACLASLLEIGIEEIPDVPPGDDWFIAKKKLDEWLIETYGVYILDVEYGDKTVRLPDYLKGYHLISGTSPRTKYPKLGAHSVVGYEGQMVHDPHPSGDGIKLGAVLTYSLLVSKGQCPEYVGGPRVMVNGRWAKPTDDFVETVNQIKESLHGRR